MTSIIFSDLDGTLLNSDRKLSDKTKLAIDKVRRKGYEFIISTGRHFDDATNFKNQIAHSSHIITSNGARIHNDKGELLAGFDISPDLVKSLIKLNTHELINNHLYTDKQWMTNKEDIERIRFHDDYNFSYELYEGDNYPVDGVAKMFFINKSADEKILLNLESLIKERHGNQLNICLSNSYCLEVTDIKASKGNALKYIANKLGVDVSSCISFGDGMNDESMLRTSGHGLIMQNSSQRLKNALPNNTVINSNDDDGVAHYLNKIITQ